jgi:hypothetical protein
MATTINTMHLVAASLDRPTSFVVRPVAHRLDASTIRQR